MVMANFDVPKSYNFIQPITSQNYFLSNADTQFMEHLIIIILYIIHTNILKIKFTCMLPFHT